ncbi:triphosphoribosyl-dephospho-CoA synthase [Methanolobus zinderi]|uniref:Triphosphoribosyl-dephospho-CoA synthase n=1 Tax=Methanolobus zinderi TaxID=536044 RepID=A0A7D5I023_9EURY|nr:triphosphoribosyl-dephospho-CoA synthase [Methanolobus zinderi]QLC49446.1 triphosphoribosyl-dephospho-CoA synthase [Methanolobus zinderi]
MSQKQSFTVRRDGYPLRSYIARCAQLAMCLEVSASPKPGNIDRHDDYEDTRYEHFLASAISMYPVMEEAAESLHGAGELIKKAVKESVSWQNGGNTHFGAIILLVPLAMAAGKTFDQKDMFTIDELTKCAHNIVKNTDTSDAIEFYGCFDTAGVKVNPVDEFSLQDERATNELTEKNVSLYELMEIAKEYDLIANEWVSGFKRCADCAEIIIGGLQDRILPGKIDVDINDVVVYSFLKILSENEDTFITTKFDSKTALTVSSQAKSLLQNIYSKEVNFTDIKASIEKMDAELLEKKINPGSTADIVIAGIFIALLAGVRY